MGTITINIDDNIENEFRNYLSEKGEILKGTLGKAITEAIERMKEGFSSGGFKIKSRSELHERKNLSSR